MQSICKIKYYRQSTIKILWKQPWRCSVKKIFLKKIANLTGKYLRWSLFLENFVKKREEKKETSRKVFSCEICYILRIPTYFEEHLPMTNDCSWYLKRSYWIPPRGFDILINYVPVWSCIMSNTSSLYMIGKETDKLAAEKETIFNDHQN